MIRRIARDLPRARRACRAPAGAETAMSLFAAKGTPVAARARLDRPARPRLPRRRRRASRVRADLAGDAPRPQPPLGQPGDHRLHRGPEPHRHPPRLEGPLRRRHRPGPRRPGEGPRQPPDRPRRRHLVHAAAAPRPHPRRPREGRRDDRPRERPAPRQRQLDAGARRAARGRRPRPARRAHLRHRPGQARALRDRDPPRCRLAAQDPAVVGPSRPLPRPPELSGRRPRLCRSRSDPAGRRLQGRGRWVTDALLPPDPNAPKPKPKPPLQLADLPAQCAAVLDPR